jgi:quercetin dioxygenase-like cupin family protein
VADLFCAADFEAAEIAPGIRTRVLSRGSLMFSLIELDEGAFSSLHRHPEEQMGLVLEGTFERHQDGEVRLLGPGDGFYVPPGAVHGGRAIGGPCRILDVFTPPRDVSVRDETG